MFANKLKNHFVWLLSISIFACPVLAGDISNVSIISQSGANQSNVPVTFGHIFRKGDVPIGTQLVGRDSNGAIVPLQTDTKAAHADGSLRHAVISANVDVNANETETITISTGSSTHSGSIIGLSDVLSSGFDANVSLNVGGANYTASAADFLGNSNPKQWLTGQVVSEWIVGGPVKDVNNNPHPHLAAYFHVRAYAGLSKIRVDVIIENNWTFVTAPGDITYDMALTVGGNLVYSNNSLRQYHHTRWHKVFWWGNNPNIVVTHDGEYIQATKAVPNYMDGLTPDSSTLNSLVTNVEPMERGNLRVQFSDTGASTQIGPLAKWDALYLISNDYRALYSSLANASAGGSYSIHYRDKNTGLPISIATYPTLSENSYATEAGLDGGLPRTSGGNQWSHDLAHQASIGYLAYLVTGDYFYLEELQFWANYNMIYTNPNYRQNEKGIFSGQNRGQVWSIRTLAQAAFITPDSHSLKQYFINRVGYNVNDRTNKWANPRANDLGAIQDYDYSGSNPSYAPWQNDWFVWVFGYVVELGFDNAITMRDWLSLWPTGRMGVADNEYCFQYGPTYHYNAHAGSTRDTFYTDFRILYEQNYPIESQQKCDPDGEFNLSTYASETMGYYSNMQPALAVAVDAGIASKDIHWARFVGVNTKPDYSNNPIWAIVPRPNAVYRGGSASSSSSSVPAGSTTSSGSTSSSSSTTSSDSTTADTTTATSQSSDEAEAGGGGSTGLFSLLLMLIYSLAFAGFRKVEHQA